MSMSMQGTTYTMLMSGGLAQVGMKPFSKPMTAPAAPASLTATRSISLNDTTFTLSWKNSGNAFRYIVQAAADSQFSVGVQQWTVAETTATFTPPNNAVAYVRVAGENHIDTGAFSARISFNKKLTGIRAGSSLPVRFALDQNFPNPFNPSTTLKFALPSAGPVRLTVHDAIGREVAVLTEGEYDAGFYAVPFHARSFASGVYFARLRSGQYVQVVKMMLMK